MIPVSIVVPVYNTEKYLPQCIDSILNQSFSDFELLLVDDGSTDDSGAICDAYAEKDNRIRVFHKDNGGVSSARNMGIDESLGDYLVFVDSDDLVKSQYLEHLMCGDMGLVISGLRLFEKGHHVKAFKQERYVEITELPEVWNVPNMNYLYCYPCAKRYLNSIIKEKNIRFDEGLFYQEDLCFVLSYMLHIEGIKELPFADYEYRLIEKNRAGKFRMNATQLIRHYETLDEAFLHLESKCRGTFYYVKNNVNRRFLRSFVAFLQDCRGKNEYIENARLFRRKSWSKSTLGLLEGKMEKRVLSGAYHCPNLSYFFEHKVLQIMH